MPDHDGRVVKIPWLKQHLWKKLRPDKAANRKVLDDLLELVEEKEKAKTVGSLPCGQMTLEDAVEAFDLKHLTLQDMYPVGGSVPVRMTTNSTTLWELDAKSLVDMSPFLHQGMQRLVLITTHSSKTEAFSRILVDLVLLDRIYEVSQERQNFHMSSVEDIRTTHSNALTSATNPSTQPRPVMPQSVPVVLNTETAMSADIMYRGEHRVLSGYADYTIAYKFPGEATKVSTSLVIVEAKRVGRLESSYGQLVAYLGIVHRERKRLGKLNTVVYGLATDGTSFKFWRIDNESELTSSLMLEWIKQSQVIISYLHHIIDAAFKSSPKASPHVPRKLRDADLKVFRDPIKRLSFDYQMSCGKLGESDTDESDDDEEGICDFDPNTMVDVGELIFKDWGDIDENVEPQQE